MAEEILKAKSYSGLIRLKTQVQNGPIAKAKRKFHIKNCYNFYGIKGVFDKKDKDYESLFKYRSKKYKGITKNDDYKTVLNGKNITKENLEPLDAPYYNVKCAGMPDRSKELFIDSLTGRIRNDYKYTEDELAFIKKKRELEDFKVGLIVPGSLKPKRIPGGIVLTNGFYEMRPNLSIMR